MYRYEDEKQIEHALLFLSDKLKNSHNSKPVLLHSIRVMLLLYAARYNVIILIAALLHDILEDINTVYVDIEIAFGIEIASLVKLSTMDNNMLDYKQQYIKNFNDIKNNKYALIIRCADLVDNASYIKLAPMDIANKVQEKHNYFYSFAANILKDEPVWQKFSSVIKNATGK